ncbi:hypothetical protein ACFQL1_13260 [Halomicroarcula sp. GCM10025709]|uniref:hypothetical protein n=1 Tax=Halomicroarcula sp. GCM10025709 TaxID=3252669 RepID=UPI00361940EE
MQASRFTAAAAAVALLGCLVAFVAPLALGAGPGIRGSVTLPPSSEPSSPARTHRRSATVGDHGLPQV